MLLCQEKGKTLNVSRSLHITVTSFAQVPSSLLGAVRADSAQLAPGERQQNVTEGAHFLQHKVHTPATRCDKAGGAVLVWSFKDVAKPCFKGRVRSMPWEPSSLLMCGCTKGKVASNPGTNGSPTTGTTAESAGTQTLSRISFPHSETQTKKLPMPIPKQKRLFEMPSTSPDTALTLCAPALDFI